MANKNRPAILSLVEKAWGSVGQEAATEESLNQSVGRSDGYESRPTKPPGRELSGSRKGPRKITRVVPPPRRP